MKRAFILMESFPIKGTEVGTIRRFSSAPYSVFTTRARAEKFLEGYFGQLKKDASDVEVIGEILTALGACQHVNGGGLDVYYWITESDVNIEEAI